MQGSSHDAVGLVAFLVVAKRQIGDNNTSISQPARNLGKEINIKIIQRNCDAIRRIRSINKRTERERCF